MAWDHYKAQRNLITKLKKCDKRHNVLTDLQDKSKRNDLKGIWKTIKLASNMAPTGNPQSTNISANLDANKFNEHFTNIGPTLQSKIPTHENVSYADFLSPPATDAKMYSFDEVLESSVSDFIKSMENNKSAFSSIPIKIFKAALPTISKALTHIVNRSMLTGTVPSFCKTARITPILKSGDVEDPNNYRPISILPVISKCIEYFVCMQLTDHMERNKLFCSQQYGFRKNHSTAYLMLDLMDNIYSSKSSNKTPAVIFLDIK